MDQNKAKKSNYLFDINVSWVVQCLHPIVETNVLFTLNRSSKTLLRVIRFNVNKMLVGFHYENELIVD